MRSLGKVVGWLLTLLGIIGLVVAVPQAYLVLSGSVEPGQAYHVGEAAPTKAEAIAAVVVFLAVLLGGMALRKLTSKRRES